MRSTIALLVLSLVACALAQTAAPFPSVVVSAMPMELRRSPSQDPAYSPTRPLTPLTSSTHIKEAGAFNRQRIPCSMSSVQQALRHVKWMPVALVRTQRPQSYQRFPLQRHRDQSLSLSLPVDSSWGLAAGEL